MGDMFKSDTLNESMVHGRSRNLDPISECPPVPAPKKPQKPKLAPKRENPERSYKLPGPVDGPDTEAGLARWENPRNLNDLIEPIPENQDAFDALMGFRRRQAGESRGRRRSTPAGSPSSRGRRSRTSEPESFSDLARALLLSDRQQTIRRPPPFRGV